MEYRRITDDFAVAGQIKPEHVPLLKAEGFKSVICNRPDGEQWGQPDVASIQAAAEAAGLAFRFVPAISGQLTEANVEDMARALNELEKPVLAYCRSGARCANLFALVQQAKE